MYNYLFFVLYFLLPFVVRCRYRIRMCADIHVNNWLYGVLRDSSAPSVNVFFFNINETNKYFITSGYQYYTSICVNISASVRDEVFMLLRFFFDLQLTCFSLLIKQSFLCISPCIFIYLLLISPENIDKFKKQ